MLYGAEVWEVWAHEERGEALRNNINKSVETDRGCDTTGQRNRKREREEREGESEREMERERERRGERERG